MKTRTNGTTVVIVGLFTALMTLSLNSFVMGQAGCIVPPQINSPYPATQAADIPVDAALAWTGYRSNVLLTADFESKTVNAVIGTGGAAANEPASIYNYNIGAIVRSTPMATKSLELIDNDNYSAGAAVFEFMNNREITTGNLEIRADLYFTVAESYYICLREQGGASKNFLDLDFLPSGNVQATYQGGTLGAYPVGRTFPILIVYRANVGKFDVWMDGKLLRTDISHSVTGDGLGGLYFGIGHDPNLAGKMYVDNISVTWDGNCNSLFDLYLSTSNPPMTKVGSNLIRPIYQLSGVECGKQYFWRVMEKNGPGSANGQVYSFTTKECQCVTPSAPETPYPGLVASNVADNTYLAWTAYNSRPLLKADFESKTADAVIGTGGASVGEPVSIYNQSIGAFVRTSPMPTKSLEIIDNDNYSAGAAVFEFLESREITSGLIEIRADLWFAEKNYYYIYLREQGGASKSFLNLDFMPGGSVRASQPTGTWSLGTYPTGRVVPVLIVCDMTTGMIDVWMDGTLRGSNITHGQTGRGIGGVYFGMGHDQDLVGRMYVDNISVTHENDCNTKFDVYASTTNPPTTLLASNVTRPYANAGTLECGQKYFWKVVEKNSVSTTSSAVWSFLSPHCVCPLTVLEANFNADAVGQIPDLTLPGDPVGDHLAVHEISGTIRVRSGIGTLIDRPVEMNQVSGIGSPRANFYPTAIPVGAPVTVGWRSMVHSSTFGFAGAVLRGDNEIIASLSYYGNGQLMYGANVQRVAVPDTWVTDVDQAFEIAVDFTTQTTSLKINGQPVPGVQNIPFEFPNTRLYSFNFELGTTSAQCLVFDDVWMCDDPITSCCVGIRGNVNFDPQDRIDLSDLSTLSGYLIGTGITLGCIEEADVNGSGRVDVSDLSMLVSHLTGGGAVIPSCAQAAAKISNSAVTLNVSAEHSQGQTTITTNASDDLTGLQLTLRGTGTGDPSNLLIDDLDVEYGIDGNSLKVVVIDLKGKNTIPSGNREVIALQGEYEIVEAVASDRQFNSVVASLAGSSALPGKYELNQNYPNPFNPTTMISFSLPNAGNVKLEVYNALGQQIRTLVDKQAEAGNHTIEWDGRNASGQTVASGVYFYRLSANDFSQSKKMLLMK